MISVKVRKKDDYVSGFHIEGHSGYAESGFDIICSAISVLSINCINSIELYTDDSFSISEDEKKGLLDFEFKHVPCQDSRLLINSMILGIKNVEKTYGSRYVSIEQ